MVIQAEPPADLTIEKYKKNRESDIFSRPYLALVRLLNNVRLPVKFSCSQKRSDLERTMIKATYILNDVFSLERDLASNSPNYITLLAKHSRDSLVQSEVIALSEHNQQIETFEIESSTHTPSSVAETQYIRLLEICLTGNHQTMLECGFRYRTHE